MLAYRELTRRRGSERPAERLLSYLLLGSGCTLKHSRVSCLLITLSSSSASASLSRSITPISGRICSWACSRSCSGVWAGTERVVAERRRLVMISPPYVLKLDNVAPAAGFLFFLGPQVPGACDVSAGELDGFGRDIREPPMDGSPSA